MSERQRSASGVLFAGFDGDAPAVAPLRELAALRPGGIVLFARNVTDARGTRELVAAIADAVGDPNLLVAVDQEGGRVARFRRDALQVPPAMAVAAAGDPGLAERLALATAGDVRRFGANVNFAPVADLATNAGSTIVGSRAFSADPDIAGAFVAATVRGLQRGGVAATLKHFPGHGATGDDSHDVEPSVDAPDERLRSRELRPFAAGIAAGAWAVMAGHLRVAVWDGSAPASRSARILQGILRDECGFAGVCFTDCMEMGAVGTVSPAASAGLGAFLAGADGVVVSRRLAVAVSVRDAIADAVARDEHARTRLYESLERLKVLRERITSAPHETEPDGGTVSMEIARRAMLIVRGAARLAPAAPVNVVSFEGSATDGAAQHASQAPSLHLALRRRHVVAELLRVPLEPDAETLDGLLAIVRAQTGRSLVAVVRRPRFRPAQVRAVAALLEAVPDAIVAIASEPFDAECFPQARNVICTFGDDELLVEALADRLSGRTAA